MKADEFIARFKGEQSSAPAAPSERPQIVTPATDHPRPPDEMIESKSALGAKLERATDRALDVTVEILDLPLPDPDNPSFGPVLRAKTAAASTAITGQLKADENAMRKPVHDEVEDVLLKLNADFQAELRQALEDDLKRAEDPAVSHD
jgi:hypothetical protein